MFCSQDPVSTAASAVEAALHKVGMKQYLAISFELMLGRFMFLSFALVQFHVSCVVCIAQGWRACRSQSRGRNPFLTIS